MIDEGIEDLCKKKLVDHQSYKLLELMRGEVSKANHEQRHERKVYYAITHSSKIGNFKFLSYMVKEIPNLLWSRDIDSRNIFLLAVLHRREEIFSLIYKLNEKNAMANWNDFKGNYILHMVGMTGASTAINKIPGATLQMQRELQWFKVISLISNFSRILSLLVVWISTLKNN